MWLVITGAYSGAHPIKLGDIIKSCFHRLKKIDLFGLYRDLVYLIVTDDSATVPSSFFNSYIRSFYSPFHLVGIRWSTHSPVVTQVSVMWVFDVCFGEAHCRLNQLPQYVSMAEDSIDRAVESLASARMNYHDWRIGIFPHNTIYKHWVSWKNWLAVALRCVKSGQRQDFYLGYILEALTRKHNLTFNTIPAIRPKSVVEISDEGAIEMGKYMPCVNDAVCLTMIAALHFFGDFRTLMSSDLPTPSPYKISSLRRPFRFSVAFTLLSAALSITLLFFLSKAGTAKQRPIVRALHVLGSLISAGFCEAERGFKVYLLWGLPTSFLLVMYASVLQSSVVAPGKQQAALSFDEMVNENYTLMSTIYKSIEHTRRTTELNLGKLNGKSSSAKDKAEIYHRELTLQDNIREMDCDLNCQFVSSLRTFRQQNRKLLVVLTPSRKIYENVMKTLGWNMVEGREVFFSVPFYVWVEMPKLWVLLKTLESMKAAGFFNDFFHHVEFKYQKQRVLKATSEMIRSGNSVPRCGVSSECVDLSDSIIAESLLLLIYCATISCFCLTADQLYLFGRSGVWKAVCNVYGRKWESVKAETPGGVLQGI